MTSQVVQGLGFGAGSYRQFRGEWVKNNKFDRKTLSKVIPKK